MNKCLVSQDERCKNAYALNMECNGYSQKCRLKPVYDRIERISKDAVKAVRKRYGIISDKE